MDSPDRRPNFLGTTIIDVDIDGANNNTDLPGWLRDVLDRALTASGLRLTKKLASKEAIESLEEVPISSLDSKECPICFEPYEEAKDQVPCDQDKQVKDKVKLAKNQQMMEENSRVIKELKQKYGIHGLQSLETAVQFNDPSLFLPVDEGALIYSRFPQRNLSTLEEANMEQILPGYGTEFKDRDATLSEVEEERHIPVKMPCNHVFGKTCLIAWLKNDVSCPLCRQEVSASRDSDPKTARLNDIRNNSFYNFNADREAVVDHMMNHSTDVFNPFRRPFNPSVTPLTDSFMHQDWVTSYNMNSPLRTDNRDPNLVLPKRFPFPETGFHPFPFPRRSRVRDLRRETRRTDLNGTNGRQSNDIESANDEDVSSNTTPLMATRREQEATPTIQLQAGDANDTRDNSTDGSPASSIGGTGGPERSRRNFPSNGRSHPYSRPYQEE
ncbi:uncharacterized protein PRCAT00002674001 [Priceomyces carsonii]|uniref:uncharacterized protein n=1 Tax=Priceomyces carsonii TaxID=28549 RepID=UPI002ED8FC40|nr:unnamed protein product [Priceomyces carsonii]